MNLIKKLVKISVLIALSIIVMTFAGCAQNKIVKENDSKLQTLSPSPSSTLEPAPSTDVKVAPTSTNKAKNPIVTIKTKNLGNIVAELYPDVAPDTVNNFISLINKGYYNGLTFHRIIPGFVIQGGDPVGNGTGGPGYSIKGEFTNNGFKNNLKHSRGILSMARSNSPDSAGSQFFIVLEAASNLDNEYAAFGKVTSGMEVVDKIAAVERVAEGAPKSPPVMEKVTVETFGVNYPQPQIIK